MIKSRPAIMIHASKSASDDETRSMELGGARALQRDRIVRCEIRIPAAPWILPRRALQCLRWNGTGEVSLFGPPIVGRCPQFFPANTRAGTGWRMRPGRLPTRDHSRAG